MVLGLIVAGAVAAGVAGVGAAGLGLLAARKIGRAYGQTIEQVYEQQRLADYYNQQSYYPSSGRSNYYYEPHGYYHTGYSYGYR